MSLPHLIGDGLQNLNVRDPYLSASSDAVSRWREHLGPGKGPRIGFAFRGNPDHQNDGNRSLDLDLFLTALPSGAEYHFLGIDLSEKNGNCPIAPTSTAIPTC